MTAIVAAYLLPPCPQAELLNGTGRAWLAPQVLPDDERAAIVRHLREFDRLGPGDDHNEGPDPAHSAGTSSGHPCMTTPITGQCEQA